MMTKFTFVVEFEDGKEPSVSAATDILGGKLVTVVFKDDVNDRVIPVSQKLPPEGQEVNLFDANGEGWLIGWRAMYKTWGQKNTGKWTWVFQINDIDADSVNITHWAEIPDLPEDQE